MLHQHACPYAAVALVLEDDAVSRAALVGCLKRRGCQPSTLRLTEDAAAQPAAYRQHDIVIIDAATATPASVGPESLAAWIQGIGK